MYDKKEHIDVQVTQTAIRPVYQDTFSGKILNSSNHKIYILKKNNQFIYVGQTKQAIGDKFRQGFRAYKIDKEKGERTSGYGGYKWISKYMGQKLTLFVIDLGSNIDKIKSEAIEAEIVYLIRANSNKWPECQNEIHFNNYYETASMDAINILDLIK